MIRFWATILLTLSFAAGATRPAYNEAGELTRPLDYREWVYLTSGVGMTYGPAAALARDLPPLFDNVFVNRESYRTFVETGQWPDKTMFVLEIRYPHSHGSINKGGYFQTDVAAIEMAVKDEQRFPEKWAYFDFRTRGGIAAATAKPLAKTAGCFACHSANGAVENTFVQFYPALLPVAQEKGTVKASFKPWTPSPAGIYHMIDSGNWPQARQAIESARKDDPEAISTREGSLNQLGYQLLSEGKKQEAATLLQYAVSLYPKSANLADSLSEMLEASGKNSEAIQVSRHVLELLDGDALTPPDRKERAAKSARERIERLSAREVRHEP